MKLNDSQGRQRFEHSFQTAPSQKSYWKHQNHETILWQRLHSHVQMSRRLALGCQMKDTEELSTLPLQTSRASLSLTELCIVSCFAKPKAKHSSGHTCHISEREHVDDTSGLQLPAALYSCSRESTGYSQCDTHTHTPSFFPECVCSSPSTITPCHVHSSSPTSSC